VIKTFLQMPLFILKRLYRKLWLRVTLYALASLIAAGAGSVADLFLSDQLIGLVKPGAVMPVLTILASSMLAVSTFSLNVMVSAHRTAAQIATPRVHRLLLEDTTTQAVLAAFVGAFVFSLTSIVLFQSGIYDDSAAIVVMGVTVLVVVLVIAAILRWIEHLSTLGSLDDSLRQVVEISEVGLTRLACDPAFGGVAMTPDTVIPTAVRAVLAPCSGYVQLLDVDGFQRCLAGAGAMYILRGPGKHVLEGQPLAQVSGDVSPEVLEELARKFLIGDRRSFEQDPVFGLHVMSEIGSKALSPGVNDAGTAIETIAGIQELLWGYAQARAVCDVRHPQVFVPVPLTQTLFEAAFGAIARDGAGQIEVALKLRKALKNLAMSEDAGTARSAHEMAALALSYGNAALPLEAEKARLREIVL
jgi:uncharacterized membrane protein